MLSVIVVFSVLALIIYFMYRRAKKNSAGGCCSGCSDCPIKGSCDKREE